MAKRDLFRSRTEEEVQNALIDAKKQARNRMRDEAERAVEYANNKQIEDVRGELMARYPETQSGDTGQRIEPITVPITERYIAEASDAYNRPVTRKIVGPDGTENTAMTATLNEELERCGYNERLHLVDQTNNLLESCGLWFQAKRGKLRPVHAYPHQIFEVAESDGHFADPADPEDYAGFVVETHWASGDMSRAESGCFAFITPANVTYYESSTGQPFEDIENVKTYPSPYHWPQVVDTADQKGKTQDLPLQMLTLWHKKMPVNGVLPDVDCDIVNANREINIHLSVLLDTIRIQGWAIPVINLLNASAAPARMPYGARFPLVLNPGESGTMLSSSTPYGEIIKTLQAVVKLIAVAHRQSPNDFSTEAVAASSGFAKLVDSLPKLEARQERIARLKYTEEQVAWPRIAAILRYLGKEGFTGDLSKFKLQVQFAGIEFPLSVDERSKQEEHDIKYNLTTPAKLLAKRTGLTVELAQKEIDENKAANGTAPADAAAQQGRPFGGGFGGGLGTFISRRSSKQEPQTEE